MFEKFWLKSPELNEKKNCVEVFLLRVLQCVKLEKNE